MAGELVAQRLAALEVVADGLAGGVEGRPLGRQGRPLGGDGGALVAQPLALGGLPAGLRRLGVLPGLSALPARTR